MTDRSSNFVLATTPPVGASVRSASIIGLLWAQPDYIQSGNELYTERNIMFYIQTKLTHKIKMSINKTNTYQKKKKKNRQDAAVISWMAREIFSSLLLSSKSCVFCSI